MCLLEQSNLFLKSVFILFHLMVKGYNIIEIIQEFLELMHTETKGQKS